MDRLMDLTVTGYLDALASAAPTPGGGSASALAAGMGAALLAMACNLTVGREKFQAVEAELRDVLARATAVQHDLAAAVDDDTAAYDAVSRRISCLRAATRRSKQRTAAIQRALEGACEVPLRVAQQAAEVVRLAQVAQAKANPNVASDANVAELLARAGMRGGHRQRRDQPGRDPQRSLRRADARGHRALREAERCLRRSSSAAGCHGASLAYHLVLRGMRDVALVERRAWPAATPANRAPSCASTIRRPRPPRWPVAPCACSRTSRLLSAAISIRASGAPACSCWPGRSTPPMLRANVAMQQGLDIGTELVDARTAHEIEPRLQPGAATAFCWEPDAGYADPVATTAAYAHAAACAGRRLAPRRTVQRIAWKERACAGRGDGPGLAARRAGGRRGERLGSGPAGAAGRDVPSGAQPPPDRAVAATRPAFGAPHPVIIDLTHKILPAARRRHHHLGRLSGRRRRRAARAGGGLPRRRHAG